MKHSVGTTHNRRRWLYVLLVTTFAYGLGVVCYGLTLNYVADSDKIIILLTGLVLAGSAGVVLLHQIGDGSSQRKLDRSHEQARQDRQALLTTINSASQAIFTIQTDHTIGIYNSAFLSLLDTNKTITSLPINDVLPLVTIDKAKVDIVELLKKHDHYESEDLLLPAGGSDSLRVHLTLNRVTTGYGESAGRDAFVCTIRDVTKQKSLEEERDEFISVVSHELRTPITIAEGSLDNARVMFARAETPREVLEKAVDVAHEQIIFLAGMINDLSTLSRAERGVADQKEMIAITELARKLFDEYEPQAAAKQLHLNLKLAEELHSVYTSRLYLEELLQNFITNAIKYTQKGHITIDISLHGSVVRFAVSDTGIGISRSDQVKIFEKFYRAEDYRTRETSGTGLGLYVAAKLAKKIETIIRVTSRLNHGSTFSIELPHHRDDQP